ncbi:MAG: valine--tRNA ligase [Calditrichaeota bacterium]|nr:valine--tRNA ligase [Calditrichota bacterium]
MRPEIPKIYNPKTVEDRLYDFWQKKNYFHAEPNPQKSPYTIVIPPPNVTDILHMGHAYNNTLQDILIRFHRMKGFETLWLPGTDHAGIATQNVVERRLLKEEGLTRHDLGREEFVKRVWQWREKYGGLIINQLKKLGASCDWSRTRFTMDEPYTRAVREVFVRLYEKGLIYRGKYIINWCPRCHTALSDEEVIHKDEQGHLWYIAYPVKDSNQFVTVATTRPETMLGDTAVAVHPEDPRYKALIGKTVILPILNREIPVIADEQVDPEFGTGAVKVTPAHDPNDFEIGRRHNLSSIVIMDTEGRMNENAGPYQGMDRFDCRKALVQELEKQGLLKKVEAHQHAVGHCQRCDTVIEPYFSEQWFVKIKPLAEKALASVQKGDIRFIPEKWTKVYENWMTNIRDWCISRQLWWGHRIPVFYCKECGHMMVKREKPESCEKCGSAHIRQDEDVLDTWFSSWLWPFATLGWPEKTEDLTYFYPTNTLVTAQDIIFFWVARMIMAGLEFMEEKPFSDVYIHGIIRDEKGRKMSKSLGNGIDPLKMVDRYSADAVRFSLIMLTSEGQDINLSESKFEMGRNFSNKIWNAFRFIMMNTDEALIEADFDPVKNWDSRAAELSDRWIVSRMQRAVDSITKALETYRFNEALTTFYNFFWHDFCDWYLELIKPRLYQKEEIDARKWTLNLSLWLLKNSMKVLHPVMPFISEEIWQSVRSKGEAESITVAPWPDVVQTLQSPEAEAEMLFLQELIGAVRNVRSEMNVPPNRKAKVILSGLNHSQQVALEKNQAYLTYLAGVETITIHPHLQEKPRQAASAVVQGAEIYVPLGGLIDLDKERERLTKEITRLQNLIQQVNKKLSNENFLKRAPEEIVQKERAKKQAYESDLEKLQRNWTGLEG